MNSNAINKLVINNLTLNDQQDIYNGLNKYFSTVGEKLILKPTVHRQLKTVY